MNTSKSKIKYPMICLFKQAMVNGRCSEHLYSAQRLYTDVLIYIITKYCGVSKDCYGREIDRDTHLFSYDMIEYMRSTNCMVAYYLQRYWMASHMCCLDLDFDCKNDKDEEEIMERFAETVLWLTTELFHEAIRLPCRLPEHLFKLT